MHVSGAGEAREQARAFGCGRGPGFAELNVLASGCNGRFLATGHGKTRQRGAGAFGVGLESGSE